MEHFPDRYIRQTLFAPLGAEGQARLGAARVLIVGCGALGTHIAEHLARAGVGFLRLVDRDVVEPSNLHRQSCFTEEDARAEEPKAAALAARLSAVNSEVAFEPVASEFNPQSALDLTSSVDLIVDGTDNGPARLLLNDVSLERGLPWIYSGVVGEVGHAQLFVPGLGPCLRCRLRDLPLPGELPTCDTAGVIGPAVGAISGFAAAIALRFCAQEKGSQCDGAARALAGRLVRIEPWSLRAAITLVPPDAECPACAGGSREFLHGAAACAGETTVLCGRSAVQVRPGGAPSLDLSALARRLRPVGAVDERRVFLRFRAPEATITVFADGRAIVEGTTDPVRARAIYDRYVGR